MGKTRPYHHAGLRDALLAEALRSLERDGISSLSLRAMAESLGVSKTAPYRHFEDKQALLVAISAEGFRMLADALEGAVVNESQSAPRPGAGAHPTVVSAASAVVDLVRVYLEFSRAHPALYRLMFSPLGYSLHSESCRANATRAFAALMKVVEHAQAAGWRAEQSVPALALSVWAQAHGWAGLINDELIPEEMRGQPVEPTLLVESLVGGEQRREQPQIHPRPISRTTDFSVD